jgi:response regulator RpfG family c-di-GMP phosphodiesterase
MEKIKLLYVDDEVENLTGFKFVFRKKYKILLASSGKEALQVLEDQPEDNPIQLVLSDQKTPKMTGVQLLEIVAKKYPKAIRMVVTGYADIDVVISA